MDVTGGFPKGKPAVAANRMMTDEDQELFLEMLLKLDETHESIKAASKWCRANAGCHEEIVRMWFFAVAKARSQSRRLYLFHLASDILFTVEPTSIQYFSSFLPQLFKAVPFVRGEEIRSDMKKLFIIWRDKKIYNKIVMDRLDKSLKNRNKVVDMAIFKYDKDLLFKNLKRVGDLRPACDYLGRGVDFAPSFDNSQTLLGTIKERKACQALLASVDSHKAKVTSLVSYMEEMVHLLKMATTTLDLAANKEQNGVEETKIRILAYGKFGETVRGVLKTVVKTWDLNNEDYAKPITPASPDPEEGTLYSRRLGTVGVPGDPRMANVPMPPVVIPSVPVVPVAPSPVVTPPIAATWGAQFPQEKPEDVFHRRDRAGSMTPREDAWPLPDDVIPFTNPAPPRDVIPLANPEPPPTRDDALFANPRVLRRDDLPFVSPRQLPFASPKPNMTPTRDSPWRTPQRSQRSVTPTLDEPWESPRPKRGREDPWDTPRPSLSRDEPWGRETPRVHSSLDDPWDTPRPHLRDEWSPRPSDPWDTPRPHSSRDEPLDGRPTVARGSTPTRDEPWSPVSPLHTGSSSWGLPLKKPVYMPCYTGFHLDEPERPRPPRRPYEDVEQRDQARRPLDPPPPKAPFPKTQRPSLLGDGPRPKSNRGGPPRSRSILGDLSRPRSILGEPSRPRLILGEPSRPRSILGEPSRPRSILGDGPRPKPLMGEIINPRRRSELGDLFPPPKPRAPRPALLANPIPSLVSGRPNQPR